MTLIEMVNFVCGKVRQADATSLARCREFIRQRYEMIYADQLWKDSVFAFEFEYDMDAIVAADVPFANYFSRDVGIWHLPSGVDKVLALRRSAQGVGVEDPYQYYRETVDAFAETGDPVAFHVMPPVVADVSGELDGVEAEGIVLSSDGSDAGAAIKIRYLDFDGEEQTLVAELPGAGGYSNEFLPTTILSLSGPATEAAVSLVLDGETVATKAAAETAAKRHLRIRLVPMPETTLALKALVKRKAQVLADDYDELAIRGMDNCVLAFAQADMLQRARQYGKAQAVQQEAVALLEQLKRIEVVQEARKSQIVPEVDTPSGAIGYYRSKGYI